MKTSTVRRACVAALLAAASIWPAAHGAGSILYSQGVATSHREGQPARIVGKGDPVAEGDVISTGTGSIAVVELKDGSRMTLRPGTVFSIEKFSQEAGGESALMQLLRGGLRAITGAIGKRNPNGYAIRTSTATIGIRGTEFDARLCERECGTEARELAPAAPPRQTPAVAARVALVQGELSASASGQAPRRLVAGAPVYAGDTLETGRNGHAVLAFRDDSRFTMQAATRFAVEAYRYDDQGGESNALFRLLRGGLRAVTGLIGKRQPQAFRMQTATATIGIRGSGGDFFCGGPCALEPPATTAAGEPEPGDGLFVHTWDGAFEVSTPGGAQVVRVGETLFVALPEQPPRLLAQTPGFLRDNAAPRPDQVPVDLKNLFGMQSVSPEQSGLYVWVRDGHVTLNQDGRQLDLGRDEAALASAEMQQPVRLSQPPAFLQLDRVPRPDAVSDTTPSFRDRGRLRQDIECR